ncbi:MAG: tail fiber domain-containing protein [Bacteroidota bacterium]
MEKKNYLLFAILFFIILSNKLAAQDSTIDEIVKPKNGKTGKELKTAAPLSDWVLNGTEIYNLSTQVGIGTSNPSHKLDILHSGSTGIRNKSTSGFSVLDIDAFSGDASIRFFKDGVTQWNLRNQPGTDNLQFFELGGGGERLQIQNNTGNIGINDPTPSEKLSVIGKIKMDDVSKGANKVLTSDANGVGTWQTVGTAVAGWAVVGSNLYNSGLGNVSIGTSVTNAPLQFSNALANRKIVLHEAANNDHQYYGLGINSNIMRYQIGTNNGNHIFYAGLTSASSKELFRISGDGSVTVNGQFTLTSDARLKKNVRLIENVMPKIMAMNGKSYNWIEASKPLETQIGFIAQEVEKIFPELVSTNETGYKSVNYIALVPVLMEGIKDLQKQLNDKTSDINKLKMEFATLKESINGISASNLKE